MKPFTKAPILLLCVPIGVGLTLSGCGGGGTRNSASALSGSALSGSAASLSTSAASVGSGRAAIRIAWPARSKASGRLIPGASNAITVQMLRNNAVIQSQTVPRPPDPADGTAPVSTVTFANLPLDTLSVSAAAYPNANGTGTAQAQGTTTLTTLDNQTVGFSLTMNTTIDHLVVTPASPIIAPGKTRQLSATGRTGPSDTTSVVLLAPSKLTWQSSDTTIASVDANGLVTAGTVLGTTTLTVTDAESGKSATAQIQVAVSPDSVGPAQFNPNGPSYAGTTTVTDGSGGWTATGDSYTFDTSANPPTLTDITTAPKTVIATGKLINGYAVFDFPHDISITKSAFTTTGSNPLVILTQGNFSLTSSAQLRISVATLGGAAAGAGPGAGLVSGTNYGGGSFGGLGGGPTSGTYGTDFTSHLQGGSGGTHSQNSVGAGGGGALYIGAVGTVTITSATLSANGAGILLSTGGGGSGGGLAIFGGGGVSFSAATLMAAGGYGKNGYGGGGGRVVVGYGQGTTAPDIGFINVDGGGYSVSGGPGSVGVKNTVSFAGF